MAWIRANLTRDGVVTTTDTWLIHRLCGAFVTDVSTASRSLLLDLDTATWSPELLELFGLAGEELPDLVDCDQIVGETNVFGPPAIPVAGLIVDQQAALLAENCLEPGTAKCTFGTGAFLLAQLGERPSPLARRPDHLGGLAAARAHLLLRRRAGLHRRLGGAVGHRPRAGARRRPTRRRLGLGRRLQRRRAVRTRAGRTRRAVVGRAGHRILHRA